MAQEIKYALNPPDYIPAKQRQRGEFTFDDPETADFVEPGDSQAMLRAVVDSYFRQQPENLAIVADRHDRLCERDPELSVEEPRSTIAILSAIHDEQSITLHETLAELSKQDEIEHDEVCFTEICPTL